jgi:ABC-type dipeptide/oligopeptide/nickel transport system permease subunit
LAIILIARLGPSMLTTAIALGVTGIPAFYRVIRTETITLSIAPFVEASTLAGARTSRILFRHICPHLYPDLIVLGSLRIGTFMLAGSGLSFIGLGAQSPTPEWGVLLSEGKQFMNTAWWLWVFPTVAIMLTVFSFNLFGDGLRDWVDERSR